MFLLVQEAYLPNASHSNPTLTIVPVIGATADPWEAAEGPTRRNLGIGRCTLWQPSCVKNNNVSVINLTFVTGFNRTLDRAKPRRSTG